MPNLEAPVELDESSPDSSVSHHEFHAPLHHRLLNTPPLLANPGPPPAVVLPPPTRPRLAPSQSYDRDIPLLEEDQHWPTRPYLLPVVLPPVHEPSLDELLRRVTERDDLHNVESVRLRVISFNVSLSSLSLFVPRLQHLNLSGSVLSSLRDLGCGLVQLQHLNVSNCGLNSFDGTGGLPSVQTLIADGNMIQRVGPLSELVHLRSLSAKNNRISELGLLSFLGLCGQLIEVQLQGNPVCHSPLYRTTLQRNVPTLAVLDGIPTVPQPDDHSATGSELSSLSSEIYSDSGEKLSSLSGSSSGGGAAEGNALEPLPRHHQRPATAPVAESQRRNPNLVQLGRPASSTVPEVMGPRLRRPSSSLSHSSPISGSVLNWTRRQRVQAAANRNAWMSSTSTSSESDAISK